MKALRTVAAIGAMAAALVSVTAGSVQADLMRNGDLAQSAPSAGILLVNSPTAPSGLQVAVPRIGNSCAATRLPRLKAAGATAGPSSKMTAPAPSSAGPIKPVDGPDGLKWLCRYDDEGQQCICIPWAQD